MRGAHDEWNIFVRINRRRPLGEQVTVFLDGRPARAAYSPCPGGGLDVRFGVAVIVSRGT